MMFLDTPEPPFDYIQDPAPHLANWRDAGPVHHVAGHDLWLVTSHDMIVRLLRDERIAPGPKHSFLAHSRAFRTTVARELRAFFGPAGDALTDEAVRDAAAECFRRAESLGTVDLIDEVAGALPVAVMARLMGIPQQDCARLRPLTEALVASYDFAEISPACGKLMDAYFLRHLKIMRAGVPTPLMAALLAAGERYDIPDALMADLCSRTLTAGSGTTAGLLGNILARLLQPGARDLDWAPSTDRKARFIEELTRLDTPLLGFKRRAMCDFELDGASFRAGQMVVLMVAAGNRDPACFPDPDAIDCNRPLARNLTFGVGSHHCLGQPLACKEIAALLDHLRGLAHRIQVLEQPERKGGWLVRQRKSLRVRIAAA